MHRGERVYRHADTRRPFVRAVFAERPVNPGEVVSDLNDWLASVLARVEGSGGSGSILRELLDGLSAYGFSPKTVRAMCARFPNLLCSNWSKIHGTEPLPGLILR